MQIKEIDIFCMDVDNDFAQIIAKSVCNDGKLSLFESKITKPEYEIFGVALGDKHVIKNNKS